MLVQSQSSEIAPLRGIVSIDLSDPDRARHVTAVVVTDATGATHWFFAPATLNSAQDAPLVADGRQE